MLDALAKWFRARFGEDKLEDASESARVRLAAVALMVEVIRADFEVDSLEQAALRRLVQEELDVEPEEVDGVIERASAAVDESVGIFGFTRLLNESMSRDDKLHLLRILWRLVYADGHKDPLEEHFVRRVADLLLLTPRDFVDTRIDVERALGQPPPKRPPGPPSEG